MSPESTKPIEDKPKPEAWLDRVYEPTKSEQVGLQPTDDLWFHNGEHLNIIQRMGFLSLFLFFMMFGVGILLADIQLFREQDYERFAAGIIGMAITSVCLLGIRNALRFKRNNSPSKQ
jgi:hypothetical protein